MTLDTIIADVRNAIVRFEKEHASSSTAYDRSFGNPSLRFQSKGETYAEALVVLKAIDAQLAELREQASPIELSITTQYLELEAIRRITKDAEQEDAILEELDAIWSDMSDHERSIVDPNWKVNYGD